MKLALKNIFFFIVINLFFTTNILHSQITRVIYKNNNSSVDSTKLSNMNLSLKEKELAKLFLKSQMEAEFELIYNKEVSLYQKIEKLNTTEGYNLNQIIDNNKYYKDLKTKVKIYQIENPELYNVMVDFYQYKWEITTESKMINGYKCYKATTIYEDIYNPYKNRRLTFNPVVWFTPDIPVSFGPKGLDGLPGLVLEGSINGKKYLYASKIEFDYGKVTKIERPKGGRDIDVKQLEAILVESFKKSQD